MKKSLLVVVTCLFIFSCSDDFYSVEDNLIDDKYFTVDERSIAFRDKVVDNGIPVEGAIVSIYAQGKRYFDSTSAKGQYSIVVPAEDLIKDGFISLNIYHPEYKSLNVTYEAPLQAKSIYDSNNISSKIVKCEDCLTITKAKFSELHHLGDDNFSGFINSQFQKDSDGLEASFNFDNSTSRSSIKVSFEAKGLQPDFGYEGIASRIVFGDQTIVLEKSPEDGSYQKYFIEFENNPDIETIKLITSDTTSFGDVDDWEFTAFYIEGLN